MLLKKNDSEEKKQKRLRDLVKGALGKKALKEEDLLIGRIDDFLSRNPEYPELFLNKARETKTKQYAAEVPSFLRKAGKNFKKSPRIWQRIEGKEDFVNKADQIFQKIRERCDAIDRPVVQKFQKHNLDLVEEFDRANSWINDNNLDKSRAELLFRYAKLLPALLDPVEMKELSKLRMKRLRKILASIEVLNNYGILVDDSIIADRQLWGRAREHILHKIASQASVGKFAGFQPHMIHLANFLYGIKYWHKGQILFDLFNRHEITRFLYTVHYDNYKIVEKRKKLIKKRISGDLGEMNKVPKLYSLLKYNSPY